MGWIDAAAEALVSSATSPTSRLLEAVIELMSAQGGLYELAPVLAELACSVVNADGAAVAVVDGSETHWIAGTGLMAAFVGLRNPRDASLAGIVIATGTAQVSPDTMVDTRVDSGACQRIGIGSMAILPIRQASHTYALLMLASAGQGEVSNADVELVAPLLRAATVKLAQASTAEVAAAQISLLQDVTATSREVLLADDPGQLLVEAVARITDASHAYLMMPCDEHTLTVTRYFGHSLLGETSPSDETSLSGSAYSSGRPKVIADWTKHPAARPEIIAAIESGHDSAARSAAYIPLMTPDGAIGVVAALMREPITASNAYLLGLLQLLAAEAGVAITRDTLRRSLADQARTDALTGLANRRVWGERMNLEVARAKRSRAPFAVALLDLDFFKRFNDTRGHLAGDELLRQAAIAWSGTLRPTDLIARLGGEEFGVILPDTSAEAAITVLQRLGSVVPAEQTVSAGVTMHQANEDSFVVMQRADEALYAAKSAGRDQVVYR
jgi:diguanylate cyclase (GGDEF)-like protein